MKTQNTILEEAYCQSHAECVDLLDQLLEAIEDMPADDPTWSRVSTLNLVARLLADAIEVAK